MSINRVIITGAGFSVPANLPVQNKILNLMKQKPSPGFMVDSKPNSFKFMNAYITVGLYLLEKYTNNDYSSYKNIHLEIQKRSIEDEAIESILSALSAKKIETGREAIEYIKSRRFDKTQKYKELNKLVNLVRNALVSEKIDVNLEDVFTSFDKSIKNKQFFDNYSYAQIDSIRLSITRLFTYYFDRTIHNYNYDMDDYNVFIKYIKSRRSSIPITIITTNWDTLLEEYFFKSQINYNLCLNEKYYYVDGKKSISNNDRKTINLIKIHGSINWFRCLNCGTLSIFKTHKISDFLFNDEHNEECINCHRKGDEETEILQPEIITPTMIKSIDSQLYTNIWNTASIKLREANEIFFVGYSMPVADYEFRYMLQKNISPKANIFVVLHQNDAPSGEKTDYNLLPESRYVSLFPKNKISFHYQGFKEFFNGFLTTK